MVRTFQPQVVIFLFSLYPNLTNHQRTQLISTLTNPNSYYIDVNQTQLDGPQLRIAYLTTGNNAEEFLRQRFSYLHGIQEIHTQ